LPSKWIPLPEWLNVIKYMIERGVKLPYKYMYQMTSQIHGIHVMNRVTYEEICDSSLHVTFCGGRPNHVLFKKFIIDSEVFVNPTSSKWNLQCKKLNFAVFNKTHTDHNTFCSRSNSSPWIIFQQ
jgi:hypothetical protein